MDFIDFHWWPVFNVADSCIVIAIVVFLVLSFIPSRRLRAARDVVMSEGSAAVALPRLDVWLAETRHMTRHAARTMIDAGLVTVDGRVGRPGQRVREAAVVAGRSGRRPSRRRLVQTGSAPIRKSSSSSCTRTTGSR